MTKGKIETALARLDKFHLGRDGEDVTDALELMRQDDLLLWVILTLPGLFQYQPLSRTLDQIKDRHCAVLDRIEAVGYVENDKDVQIVSELVDDIRDVVTDYQVSSDPKQFPHPPFKQNWFRWRANRPYMIRIST